MHLTFSVSLDFLRHYYLYSSEFISFLHLILLFQSHQTDQCKKYFQNLKTGMCCLMLMCKKVKVLTVSKTSDKSKLTKKARN